MTLRCSERQISAGFTLIELLVVIAIISIMVGMAIPLLDKSMSRTALDVATAGVRADLREISVQAMTEGRTIVFRGDPAVGYWIDRRHRQIDAGAGSASRARVAVAGAGRVSFFSWGGSSGGVIWVENREGRREILIDAVTGRAVARP